MRRRAKHVIIFSLPSHFLSPISPKSLSVTTLPSPCRWGGGGGAVGRREGGPAKVWSGHLLLSPLPIDHWCLASSLSHPFSTLGGLVQHRSSSLALRRGRIGYHPSSSLWCLLPTTTWVGLIRHCPSLQYRPFLPALVSKFVISLICANVEWI